MVNAIRVIAPHTTNGNSRRGWIISTHAKSFEAFIVEGGQGSGVLYDGLDYIKAKMQHDVPLGWLSPYDTNDFPINVSAGEFRRYQREARKIDRYYEGA